MITAEVISRVLTIRSGKNVGTAFTFDLNGRQYLTTALHVVSGDAPIEVFRNGAWDAIELAAVWGSNSADAIVYEPAVRLPQSMPCPLSSTGIVLGQEAFILGYPLALRGGDMNGYPIPLVRKCALSWIGTNADGTTLFILDGIATPGLSGGPLAFRPAERADAPFQIAGVVLGFWPEVLPVDYRNRARDEEPTLTVTANSGLMVCAAIENVLNGIASAART